jgi:hypothetical protein
MFDDGHKKPYFRPFRTDRHLPSDISPKLSKITSIKRFRPSKISGFTVVTAQFCASLVVKTHHLLLLERSKTE